MCSMSAHVQSCKHYTFEYQNNMRISERSEYSLHPNILYINICYSVLNNSQISEMTRNISDSQAQSFTHRTNLEGMVINNCPRRDRQLIIIIESCLIWIYTCMLRKSEFGTCYC